MISQNGCHSEINHEIQIDNLIPIPEITAFRPDGDTHNDFYRPLLITDNIVEYDIEIISRTGQCVFSSKDPEEYWDGKFKGTNEDCKPGVYGVRLYLKDKYNVKKQYKLSITLLGRN